MELQDNSGCSALAIAARGGACDVMKALLQAGASVDGRTKTGASALMKAAEKGQTLAVAALIAAKAPLEAQDANGNTALICASRAGHVATVLVLIKAHTRRVRRCGAHRPDGRGGGRSRRRSWQATASLDTVNASGVTALIAAADEGHGVVVGALALAHAALNEQENQGDTALIRAARHGHVNVLQCLIDAGAQMSVTNERGKTALREAREVGNSAAAAMLQKAIRAERAQSASLKRSLTRKISRVFKSS